MIISINTKKEEKIRTWKCCSFTDFELSNYGKDSKYMHFLEIQLSTHQKISFDSYLSGYSLRPPGSMLLR